MWQNVNGDNFCIIIHCVKIYLIHTFFNNKPMINKFKSLCISALLLLCLTPATAQVTRIDSSSPAKVKGEAPRGVMLAPEMLAKAAGRAEKKSTVLPELSAVKRVPQRALSSSKVQLPAKGTAKITDLQGYCSYTGNTDEIGWRTFSSSMVPSVKWGKTVSYKPSTGFVRGDEVYTFYTYTTTSSGLTDAGYYILDLNNGEVKSTVAAAIFDSLEEVVVAAAYDAENDIAYVITYNAGGSAYILQQFNPADGTFTNLGMTVPSDWLELGWNPADKSLYMFDESGYLKKYDAKAKKFNQVNSFGLEIDAYTQSMAYSPKDNAFIMPIDIYDETDGEYTAMFLLPVSGAYTYLGTLSDGPQYAILYTSDEYVNAEGPKAPVLKNWGLSATDTQGNFTVTLPSTLENGTAISGKVYLRVTIDNVDMSGSYSGNAGTDVTVPVNLAEGMHRFIVTPYVLGDDGRVYGTPLVFDRTVGADVPSAPANVKLTKTLVSWDAVTEGANGGYLDAASVTYKVYIDKILMNETPVTGTSLEVTIPASGKVAHTAEVYAISGDKVSEAGVSAKLYEDGALSIPVFLGPEDGAADMDDEVIAMFTPVKDIMNTGDMRGWRYDDQTEHTGGFYCLYPTASSTGNNANEWLFLPAINFTDADAHYKLTMDVWCGGHFFSGDETYEIALCQRPNGSRPTVIREATIVYNNPNFETSETIFQVPSEGEWYIGIHYISPIGVYRLYARNFRVEVAQSTADSPEAVTDLIATAAERGELTATLSFKMPVNSISGTPLDAATVITATATSTAGSATVTGKPGEKVSVSVPTVQGDNIITVTTSSDNGQGKLAEVTVYCGIYRPATPYVTVTVSDDNTKLILDFDLDDYNEDGEYTGPDMTDVLVYRQINGEWRVAADLGKKRTWEFTATDPTIQDMYSFGVASKNEVGYSEEMYTFMVHLGKLYALPMVETFPVVNEALDPVYEPISVEHLSYLQSTWGYADPTEVDETAGNASGNALCAMWDGESQLVLPRFSTLGMNNVKLDLSLYFGNLAPEAISIFASTKNREMEPVASFTADSGKGWEHKLVSLPSICQNQPWVQVIIRVKIVGYTQTFMMDGYTIKNYPDDMMTISSFEGPTRAAVGKTLTYHAEIENAGSTEAPMPDYTFLASTGNGAIEHLLTTEAPATIAAGKKVTLSFNVTPKAAHKGSANVSFKLNGQPVEATTTAVKDLEVLNAPIPVVTDLSASVLGEDVLLSWSEPVFTENFEACEPWDMSDNIADFNNIDLDGGKEWGISEVTYLGKGAAKGFQVFNSSITSNPLFAAHSGSHYLICVSASKVASNDWLISPEVEGGSRMSFWMNNMSSDYPETVLVMYSTTGNDVDDFTEMLDNGYVCPEETGWTKYEFTLPADAKYFALNHVAEDPEAAFGFMLDDISYEAKTPVVSLDGYNVYRDNEAIANDIVQPNFTDTEADLNEPVRYYVMSVGTANNEKIESDRSNVIWVESSGVNDIVLDNGCAIYGVDGAVVISGFTTGETYSVSNVAGAVVAEGVVTSASTRVALSTGIYVVKCGDVAAKVAVK